MLPPQDDRRWLEGEMAALVAARGPAPLINALLLEPTPRYFPDRWGGGEASVRRLFRRLANYARLTSRPSGPELPERAVKITIYDADPVKRGEVIGKPPARGHQELSSWLVSATASELKIGVEASALADPSAFVAAAARVVAHAWRVVHDLPLKDAYDPRIDVTAVYLGFALLTADAALRFTSRTATGTVANRKTPLRVGSLPPQAVCYLLAAQAHVRVLERSERARIARSLQANQAAFFRHAYAAIERMDPPIAAQWHIPPREHWPAPPSLPALTAPLSGEDDGDEPEARRDEDPGVAGLNLGKPVFLIDRSMAPRLGRVLFMGVLMLGGVVGGMSPNRSGTSMGIVAAAALVLGLLGLTVGRLVRDRRCSEPKCGAPLKPTDKICPRCSGTIAGTIAHPRERLAAEEALHRAQAAEPPSEPVAPA
jgi:hypothetical protein